MSGVNARPDGRRAMLLGLAGIAPIFIASCAQITRANSGFDAQTALWSGRLALRLVDPAPRAFSAAFELRGSAEAGELKLYNPLGGTVAALVWRPGTATLDSNGRQNAYESVDAMVLASTGAAVPIIALFDWLSGRATVVDGWEPDLSQRAEGRLSARRTTPTPIDLRLILDRTPL